MELGDEGVVLLELFMSGAQFSIGLVAARKNGQQQNLRARRLLSYELHDSGDAARDAGRVVAAGIVGADHDNGSLGLEPVEFAVFETPEHVLRAVTADAEVGRLVLSEGRIPDLRLPPPPGCDGVP